MGGGTAMRKIIWIVCFILTATITLTGCSESDIPTRTQVVNGLSYTEADVDAIEQQIEALPVVTLDKMQDSEEGVHLVAIENVPEGTYNTKTYCLYAKAHEEDSESEPKDLYQIEGWEPQEGKLEITKDGWYEVKCDYEYDLKSNQKLVSEGYMYLITIITK